MMPDDNIHVIVLVSTVTRRVSKAAWNTVRRVPGVGNVGELLKLLCKQAMHKQPIKDDNKPEERPCRSEELQWRQHTTLPLV